MPEISVIIPVYNKRKYVASILSMIKEQGFSDFECIMIDDGSSDGSENVCDDFEKRDIRFKVAHITNGGVSNARNIGLSMARGKFLTFIDADDEIPENYFELLYRDILKTNADLVISSFEKIFENDNRCEIVNYPLKSGLYSMNELLSNFAFYQRKSGIFGWCWGKLVKREILDGIEFDKNLKLAEDFDFYLRLYPKIKRIYIDADCKYRYRVDAENGSMISAQDDEIDYYSQLVLNLRYRDFLIEMSSFHGDNKQIVSELLSNYSYYILLHSASEKFCKDFEKVYHTWRKEKYPLIPFDWNSRILLTLLKYNLCLLAKAYYGVYQFLRKTIRKREIRE